MSESVVTVFVLVAEADLVAFVHSGAGVEKCRRDGRTAMASRKVQGRTSILW